MSQHPYGLQYIFFFCSLGTFSGFTKGWKIRNLLFITVYSILYMKYFFVWKNISKPLCAKFYLRRNILIKDFCSWFPRARIPQTFRLQSIKFQSDLYPNKASHFKSVQLPSHSAWEFNSRYISYQVISHHIILF